MRLIQLIRESNASSILSKYFNKDLYSNVEETPDGLNVDGDLQILEGVSLKEIPVKLNHITGALDLLNCGLTSLKNAPNSCKALSLGYNENLTSLASDMPINTEYLIVDGTGITDLSGLNIVGCKRMSFDDCLSLKSLNGLGNTKLELLSIMNCPSFEDDLTQYNIENVEVKLESSKKMPIVFLIAFGSPKIKEIGPDTSLTRIAKKYLDKGPGVVLDLIRELRDQGFKDAARIP